MYIVLKRSGLTDLTAYKNVRMSQRERENEIERER